MKRAPGSEPPLRNVGPYRLEKSLRIGAAFSTYRAVHDVIGNAVWITMTPSSVEPSVAANEKLIAGAKVLATLARSSVLGLLAVLDDAGRVAVVTEAPGGPSLRDIMNELTQLHDVPVEQRAALAVAFARAVGEVHEGGVAHGSLSPENAFFSERGTIHLAGFWDAHILSQERRDVGRDVPDAGPEERYRSPERIVGKAVDRAGDVFSCGVVAYEIITGRHPFAEETRGETLARRIRATDPAPSEAPADIDAVLQKSLQKVPTLRHETGSDFADDLVSAVGGRARAHDLSRALYARLRGRPEIVVPPRLEAHARRLARSLAVLTVLMVLVGIYVVAGDRTSSGPSSRSKSVSNARVKVLARPWADVYVDGERVDTTPIGHPLSLSPGRHELLFKHPRAPDQRRVLELEAGEQITVDIEMDVVRPVDAGGDPSP
ncbi:MAG: protein kinase [Polyangiaceae bacterium]|nr:protein kinase [Polyangiaceae bacterium]